MATDPDQQWLKRLEFARKNGLVVLRPDELLHFIGLVRHGCPPEEFKPSDAFIQKILDLIEAAMEVAPIQHPSDQGNAAPEGGMQARQPGEVDTRTAYFCDGTAAAGAKGQQTKATPEPVARAPP